jgi:dTDP-4-dehydrorhamnose reductase
MKVMILGTTGMLGNKVETVLRATQGINEVISINKDDFCLPQDIDALLGHIVDTQPNIVVNCIGFIKPTAKVPSDVIMVNSVFPHLLAKTVNSINGRVIHISTDCVFDGKAGPYSVTSSYTANDLYGMSKALGELNDNKNLTIRTSLIGRESGDRKRSLVEWFLQQSECNGFTNHLWSGVTTTQAAKFIATIITKDAMTGLIQYAPEKSITKHDLLCLLKKRFNKETIINPVKATEVIDRRLVPTVLAPSIEDQIMEM